jgi:hypothetical protein
LGLPKIRRSFADPGRCRGLAIMAEAGGEAAAKFEVIFPHLDERAASVADGGCRAALLYRKPPAAWHK